MGRILETFLKLLQKRYFREEDGEFIRKIFANFQSDSNLLLLLYALGREDLNLYASEVFVISLHCNEEHQERLFHLLDEVAELEAKKSEGHLKSGELEKKHRIGLEIKKIFLEGLTNYKKYLFQNQTLTAGQTRKSEGEIENEIVKALKRGDEYFCSDSPGNCPRGCSLNFLHIVEASPSTGNYHVYAFLDSLRGQENPDRHFMNLKFHLNQAMVQVINEKYAQGIPSMVEGVKFWIKAFFTRHLMVHKKSYLRDGISKAENATFVLHNARKKVMYILTFTLDYGI